MTSVLIAVLIAAMLALAAGLILSIASVVFAVPKDETVETLKEVLPGANCGACGFSGCEGYAAAMAHEGAAVGLCSPGGDAVAKATGAILGVEGAAVKKVAVVRCAGCNEIAARSMTYAGLRSCKAAVGLYNGGKDCAFGCIGYGDCAAACDRDAIRIENGIAVIDTALCGGCGVCEKACPKGLIAIREMSDAPLVKCRNRDKGGAARKVCKAACIGCMKCQKVCEAGAITVTAHLAAIDEHKCVACDKCQEACPQGCIV